MSILLQCHLFQLSGFLLFFFFFSYNKSYAMLYISDDAFLAFAATIQSVMNGSSRLIFGFLFDKYGFKVRVWSQSANIFTKFLFFCRTHYSFKPCPVPPSPSSLWTSPSLTAMRLGQSGSFSLSHLPFMASCQVDTFFIMKSTEVHWTFVIVCRICVCIPARKHASLWTTAHSNHQWSAEHNFSKLNHFGKTYNNSKWFPSSQLVNSIISMLYISLALESVGYMWTFIMFSLITASGRFWKWHLFN